MATNFSVKIGEIGLFTFIRRSDIRKWIAISHFMRTDMTGWPVLARHWPSSGHHVGPCDVSALKMQLFDSN